MSFEWPHARLGDLCSKIGSGATPRGGADVYTDEGVAFIRSQNIYDDRFSPTGLVCITDHAAEKLKGVSVEVGDVLINITGDSVARVNRAPAEVIPARVNQHVAILRPRAEGPLSASFLHHLLVNPDMKNHLLALASAGATRNALTKKMLEDLEIPMPSELEQRRIERVLGSLDEKIESNRRLATTLQDVVLHYSQHLSGQAKSSVRLEEICTQVKIPGTDAEPYVGLDSMPRASTVLDVWEEAGGSRGESWKFEEGDLLFGKLRPNLRKAAIAPISGRATREIVVLRPVEPHFYGTMIAAIASQPFADFCMSVATGTRMPRAEWKLASKFEIGLPDTNVEALDGLARTNYSLINTLTRESRTLGAIRDQVLPMLISGKLRVPEDAFESAEAA